MEKAGGTGLTVEADVTRAADVARYAAAVAERFGGIDYFFNNAGILGAVRPLVEYPEDVFDRVLAVNVKGVWLGIKTVAPLLRARGGGVIVNTASIAGLRGSRNLVAYTASKHAVVGITRAPRSSWPPTASASTRSARARSRPTWCGSSRRAPIPRIRPPSTTGWRA